MANLSDFTENLLLNWLMTTDSVTRPTAWHVGLFSAAPSDAGGGTEISGTGYARQSATFATASSGATSNTNTLTWTNSGGTDWPEATHWAIFDAASGGNMLWHAALTVSKTVGAGDDGEAAPGELDLSLD